MPRLSTIPEAVAVVTAKTYITPALAAAIAGDVADADLMGDVAKGDEKLVYVNPIPEDADEDEAASFKSNLQYRIRNTALAALEAQAVEAPAGMVLVSSATIEDGQVYVTLYYGVPKKKRAKK